MKKKILILLFAAFCFGSAPMVIQSCSAPSSGTKVSGPSNPGNPGNPGNLPKNCTGDDDPSDLQCKKDDPSDPEDND